jgi:Na+/H+ antiporter NhaD/arsenite permease-like protein
MNSRFLRTLLVLIMVGSILLLVIPGAHAQGETPATERLITGKVVDKQGQPVESADVTLDVSGEINPIAQVTTQSDGRYTLIVPSSDSIPDNLSIRIQRAHFKNLDLNLGSSVISSLRSGEAVAMPMITLTRQINLAFWIATLTFLIMLLLMAADKLHNTLAALVGASIIFAFSYSSALLGQGLFIFNFQGAIKYVDWNVIFLVMGMMIIIAVVERTGIFQWLALVAYQLSGGRAWLLVTILMIITGITSAFLDNVTTMLLMTPITVQIALALGINPLALLMPEVMASNVIGISTLIGTPTNILIGSYANISFNGFLVNLTPGVILAMVGLVIYSQYAYRQELQSASEVSPLLLEKLSERAHITEPVHLRKVGWVGAGMLVLFIFGENLNLVPAVTALIGATVLLVWIKPDIEEMIEAVDWTTLVFFIALFIVVGAIQEVGLISMIADLIARLVGGSLILTMLTVIWVSALISTVIANIPFTAAMLPVIGYLSVIVPGAHSKVLFFSLAVGSALGGNGSLIGASANMVTAGISERAGYPISYIYFLKKGFPALLITVGLATVWLLLRFLVLSPPPG